MEEIVNVKITYKNKWSNIGEHFENSKNKALIDEVIATGNAVLFVDDTVSTESKNS